MATVRAKAEVDFPSDAGEHWSLFCTALRASPPEHSAQEPAKKRRKRTRAVAVPVTDVPEDDYALVATLLLRLEPPRDSQFIESSSPTSSRLIDTYPVILGTECRRSANTWAFEVSPAYDPSIALPLRSADEEVAAFLRHATKIRNNSAESVVKVNATFDTSLDETGRHLLQIQIHWRFSDSDSDPQTDIARLPLLDICFPRPVHAASISRSPDTFYQSVYSPPLSIIVASQVQHPSLCCTLYPFQRRAVHWLLEREGVCFNNGTLIPKSRVGAPDNLPMSFMRSTDGAGRTCYISSARGVVVRDLMSLQRFEPEVRGGILAEEMGLGKTVELIALMCLHKRTLGTATISKNVEGVSLTPSGATLIITPQHILQQWMDEIEIHAPHLRVLHYTGMISAGIVQSDDELVDAILQYDVVLTTYGTLSKEIHWANPPPDRTLRHAPTYERHRSPLVLISWWRVCLDEAQMIESGVSQAAELARLIPRVNAWSVTGTPIKKYSHDLLGILTFLRYEPFATKRVWNRIDQGTFKCIFSSIALRHSKDQVRHELQLPPQRRVVITTPFTAVEEQHYSQLAQEMCEELRLNLDGSPLLPDYNPRNPQLITDMRAWLRQLRQTCLHPDVGKNGRRMLGRSNGPMRTIAEVLEALVETNEAALRTSEREVVMAQVLRAHIIAYNKGDPKRSERALSIYHEALNQADRFVMEGRRELEEHLHTMRENNGITSIKDDATDIDSENESNAKDGEQLRKTSALRKALRSALEVQHSCCFFVGTAFYQLKTDEEKESQEYMRLEGLETQYYDRAKLIRKELLRDPHVKAERIMRRLAAKAKTNTWTDITLIPELSTFGGIESRRVAKKLEAVSNLLDKQAVQIELWRNSVVQRLLKPLVDEDEGQETTGEEYEDSTKVQDELFVYMTGLRALIADRQNALSGISNYRVDHELREALKLARSEEGHSPKLMTEIVQERAKLKPRAEDGYLKHIVAEFRSLATKYIGDKERADRARIEVKLVENYLKEVQKILTEQTGILAELEKEQELFHTAMNQRVEFYKQLQAISDTVAPYKEEMDDELDVNAFSAAAAKEEATADRLSQLRTKRNYLHYLRTETANKEAARECVICRNSFENGVLTICGHLYCSDCIRQWWRSHHNCPICKRTLHRVDFYEITYKPHELRAREEQADSPSGSPSKSGSERSGASGAIYSDMHPETLQEIKAIDLPGSYGTKIDTLARHIIWLRDNDPGAKSIIFSQFTDFLTVLSGALNEFKIGHASIHASNGIERFRKDSSVECFLLDAKSDSSGLNLVTATHVFLCEPLINTAIELQAIARVHRIGQLRPTTVYMYLVSDTVEEAIYEISVQRRLAHISRGSSSSSSSSTSRAVSGRSTPALPETALDKANSLELQQAHVSTLLSKGKSGGEIVGKDDLWNCLFSKAKRAPAALPADAQQDVGRQLSMEAAETRRKGRRA